MDVWDTFPQVSRRSNRRDHHHPSFSSTLLDAIYRSIDDPNADSIMRNKTHANNPFERSDDNSERSHRGRKAVAGELHTPRRKSTAEYTDRRTHGPNSNSSSASSDSSGGFSSEESDSLFHKPKPIRTSLISRSDADKMNHHYSAAATHQKQQSKREGGFVRTKSKALKIYSDLKKVKQPISPGGRLASFLNSLFTAGNPRKAKMIYDERKTTTKTADQQTAAASSSSTCSSASSFSRSCLSKTPSSRSGKSTTTTGGADSKRSVTFYPVSVIVDEDCKPCGQKRLHENQMNQSDKELEFRILEENRRVVEAAKELLKSYHQKKLEYDNINGDHKAGHVFSEDDDEDDDDDDGASCSSSDLFELDNLSAIGIERYREELPVYETTHLDTNRAIIASALFV